MFRCFGTHNFIFRLLFKTKVKNKEEIIREMSVSDKKKHASFEIEISQLKKDLNKISSDFAEIQMEKKLLIREVTELEQIKVTLENEKKVEIISILILTWDWDLSGLK